MHRHAVRALLGGVAGTGIVAGMVKVIGGVLGVSRAVGAPAAELQQRAEASTGPAHGAGGRYHNTLPDEVVQRGAGLAVLRAVATRGRLGRPRRPVPLVADQAPQLPGELVVTWYGHSSVLLELDGHRVLADPVWSDRVSPSATVGPRRLHPVPVPLAAVPPVDAVVISHDHYDHLDLPTVQALLRGSGMSSSAPFVVPLGVGAHLRRWGVPDARIVELGWGGSVDVGGLTLICGEARHFSGRALRRNTTLWASWMAIGPRHRVFLGGDTGYTPAFAALGRAYGPMDLTVLPIGSYSHRWPCIHMSPEGAVRAHVDLTEAPRPGLLVPVHWATFALGLHGWAEPIQRLILAAEKAGVPFAAPRPGQRVDARHPPASLDDWWTAVS